jgi:thiol-disulfide isomerase/thioredoxin
MPKTALFIALSLATAGGFGALETASHAVAQTGIPLLAVPRGTPRPAPAWRNKSWLNTERPLTIESLKGRVVLLNFWVFTCYNCTNTVPSLVDFDGKYRNRGLTIIGVHTPEFPPYSGEHDKGNLQRALEKYHIEYPVTQDNDTRTWDLYGIRYWPSFVLIDKRGQIRYEGAGEFHVGDPNYQYWDGKIRELLDEQ